ncbi:AMP-binding protein [Sphaerotilus sp.]|uniref:AMP-binding protein n=1 Tax=Sphaerotilus sp. TaxID=2093942 RepID=UPI00286EB317|nr:AMP-binding protein [Sphaerotilus sp.]
MAPNGPQINYARQVFRHADAAQGADIPALLFRNERLHDAGRTLTLGWPELQREVASLAVALRGMGVQPLDRVAAYLPNAPQTVAAFLACASLGAVWSVCSPDLDAQAVLDRFGQIAPKVLIACDGTTRGGRDHDRLPTVHALLAGLPSVTHLVLWPCLDRDAEVDEFLHSGRHAYDLRPLLAGDPDFTPLALPSDHPLWIAYANDTGGLPTPSVQDHGSAVQAAVQHNAQQRLGATTDTGDRLHWSCTPGGALWMRQVGGLLGGTTLCLFDGHPSGSSETPDGARLWQFVAETGVTCLGADAAFYADVVQVDTDLPHVADLSALRTLVSTGPRLASACVEWLQTHLPQIDGQPVAITQDAGTV